MPHDAAAKVPADGDVHRGRPIGIEARDEDVPRPGPIRGRLFLACRETRTDGNPQNGVLNHPVPLNGTIFLAADEVVA